MAIGAILAVVVVLGACGDSGEDADSSSSSADSASTSSGTTGYRAPDADVPTTLTPGVPGTSMEEPARNTLYSCFGGTLTGYGDVPWVNSEETEIDLIQRPFVEGEVTWDSEIKFTEGNNEVRARGNGLPDHPTGEYPPRKGTAAYEYYVELDVPPESPYENGAEVPINEYELKQSIPGTPVIADEPSCVPFAEIGVALSGSLFFDALDANNQDAQAVPLDECFGHPEPVDGVYHYHPPSFPCFEQGEPTEHSPQVGYALDGFGIYGIRGEGGENVTNDELDECHGHIGAVPGEGESVFHYHLNGEFPYSIGCFRGTPGEAAVPPPKSLEG